MLTKNISKSFLNELEKTAQTRLLANIGKKLFTGIRSFLKGSAIPKITAGTNIAGGSVNLNKNPISTNPDFSSRISGFTGSSPANLNVGRSQYLASNRLF